MSNWKVYLKWTGVSHEKVIVKADTKEEAEALIKRQGKYRRGTHRLRI